VTKYVGWADVEATERERQEAPPQEAPAREGAAAPGPGHPPPEEAAAPRAPAREAPAQERGAHGYWRVDNWIPDVLMPRLDQYEQLVMWRVLRLTIGFNRPACVVGVARLAEKCRISENSVTRAVRRLESAGYIATRPVINGPVGARGLEFRLLPAAYPPEATPREGPARQAGARQRGAQQAGAPRADMKDSETKSESAVYEVRRIAARLWESRAPGSDLRAELRTALRSHGIAWDDATVDEATRGMK
jgi:DNA-binding Lrp family transcriptional regulator